jgi:hypothetical protein
MYLTFNKLGEFFEILFKQKNYYYSKNNESQPFVIEESKIDEIIQKYNMENLYYGLDKKNIFKRIDRFEKKKVLIVIFTILCIGNLHEIIFNIVHLAKDIDPDDPDKGTEKKTFYNWNIFSEFFCDVYIGTLLVLCWITFTKLKIDTKIYF